MGREEGRSGGLSDWGGLGEGTRAQCMLGVQHRVRHECGRGNTGHYCHRPPPTCSSRVWEHLAHSLGLVQVWGSPGDTEVGRLWCCQPDFPCCLAPAGRGRSCGLGRPAWGRTLPFSRPGGPRCRPCPGPCCPPGAGFGGVFLTPVLTLPGPGEPEVPAWWSDEGWAAPRRLGARNVPRGLRSGFISRSLYN